MFQENVRSVIKWFDDYLAGYRKDKDDSGSVAGLMMEGEVVNDEEWDWERWKKHFDEVDEQERIVSLLQVLCLEICVVKLID